MTPSQQARMEKGAEHAETMDYSSCSDSTIYRVYCRGFKDGLQDNSRGEMKAVSDMVLSLIPFLKKHEDKMTFGEQAYFHEIEFLIRSSPTEANGGGGMISCESCQHLEFVEQNYEEGESGYCCNKRQYLNHNFESKHLRQLDRHSYRIKKKSCGELPTPEEQK